MKKTIKSLIFIALLFLNIKMIKAADYIWPIDEKNAYETYIEYGYGKRNYDSSAYDMKYNYAPYEGIYTRYENHYGVDITGIKGNTYDVVSVVDGTVLTTSLDQIVNPRLDYVNRNQRNASFDGGGYGNYIVIKEDKTGLCFLYGHLNANSVTLRNGDRVSKGQKIGIMGSSGDSGHMHLHFEVRLNQSTTTTGKNLVITRQYGLETLDPTNYIGNNAPEKKIVEPTNPIVEDNTVKVEEPTVKVKEKVIKRQDTVKESNDNSKAKVTNIEYIGYSDFGKIIITLDKTTDKVPSVKAVIGGEDKHGYFVAMDNNSYIYTLIFNEFDITTYGDITLYVLETDEIEAATANAGYLNEYVIPQTFEDSYYYKLGDLNKDGYVDAVDASLTLKIYKKLATEQPLTEEENDQKTRADINKDGYVNSIDASLMLDYYSYLSTTWSGTKQEKIIACEVTGDHIVDTLDYEMIKIMTEQNVAYNEKYDTNKDGKLDSEDIAFFKQVLKTYGSR